MSGTDEGSKSQVVQAVKDAAVPKEKDGKVSWKKVTTLWSRVTWVLGVLGSLIYGFNWVHTKIQEIEQRGVDIQTLKESNDSLLQQQQQLSERITTNVNAAREQIREEFNARDETDRALDARITAVLNEMRARHGVVPLAGGESRQIQIREAEEAASASERRVRRAMPGEGTAALSGLEGL